MVQNVFDVKITPNFDLSGLENDVQIPFTSTFVTRFPLMPFLDYLDVKICFSKFLQDDHLGFEYTSRKYLRTKVTPDFYLTYSKNGGNLGSESK